MLLATKVEVLSGRPVVTAAKRWLCEVVQSCGVPSGVRSELCKALCALKNNKNSPECDIKDLVSDLNRFLIRWEEESPRCSQHHTRGPCALKKAAANKLKACLSKATCKNRPCSSLPECLSQLKRTGAPEDLRRRLRTQIVKCEDFPIREVEIEILFGKRVCASQTVYVAVPSNSDTTSVETSIDLQLDVPIRESTSERASIRIVKKYPRENAEAGKGIWDLTNVRVVGFFTPKCGERQCCYRSSKPCCNNKKKPKVELIDTAVGNVDAFYIFAGIADRKDLGRLVSSVPDRRGFRSFRPGAKLFLDQEKASLQVPGLNLTYEFNFENAVD